MTTDQGSHTEGYPQKGGQLRDPQQDLHPTIPHHSLTLYRGCHTYTCPCVGHLGTLRWVRPFRDLEELTVKAEGGGKRTGEEPEIVSDNLR